MRVLTITNMYPPHHYGGYELCCEDVMNRWRAGGHEIVVLTTDLHVPDVVERRGDSAIDVRRELEFYWLDHQLLSPSIRRRLGIERRNQRRLASVLDEIEPDVVSVWAMGAMSLGLLTTLDRLGVPRVHNVHDDWLVYGVDLDAWLRIFAARPRLGSLVERLLRVPAHVPDLSSSPTCFSTEFVRSVALERGRLQVGETVVIRPGIDHHDFPVLDAVPARDWTWRLLYVGRIDERKGIETAIRALPLLPAEAGLEILGTGDGGELARLERIVSDLDIAGRVRFGSCPRSELRTRYAAADVCVFPSMWKEPFGLVPLEAMACGTPVVSTGVGGSAEFLEDGRNCTLFPAGNEHELAQRLRELAADPLRRATLVEGGLATARRFSVDRLADELETWHLAASEPGSTELRVRPAPDASEANYS